MFSGLKNRLICIFSAWVCLTATAFGAPVVQPAGIGFGDSYRLAFVTSVTTDAVSGDVSVYNDFVTSVANSVTELADLELNWFAVVSTGTVDAHDNTFTKPSTEFGGSVGVPIFLLDGTKLVDSNDDLSDGSLDRPFDVMETGDAVTSGTLFVGTGTTTDGTVFPGRPMGASFPEIGFLSSTTSTWVRFDSSLPETERRIYAISEQIDIPLPGPGPLGLMMAGLIFMTAFRRR